MNGGQGNGRAGGRPDFRPSTMDATYAKKSIVICYNKC
jgi:hypothetical protein